MSLAMIQAARTALRTLDDFLSSLSLRILVEGTGLARGARLTDPHLPQQHRCVRTRAPGPTWALRSSPWDQRGNQLRDAER